MVLCGCASLDCSVGVKYIYLEVLLLWHVSRILAFKSVLKCLCMFHDLTCLELRNKYNKVIRNLDRFGIESQNRLELFWAQNRVYWSYESMKDKDLECYLVL